MDQYRKGLEPIKREYKKPSKFIKPSGYQYHHRAAAPVVKDKAEPAAEKTQLLAGYMAYEFLSKGTLLGQPWEQIRAKAKPSERSRVELAKVSTILKHHGGIRIPGVFNPTQLPRPQ